MTREKLKKYINFFKEIYLIAPKIEPNFWDAVETICLNSNYNKYTLGLKENPCCLIKYYCYHGNYIPVLNYVPTDTVLEFAEQIANEIYQIESTTIDPLEHFILQKKYEELLNNSNHI